MTVQPKGNQWLKCMEKVRDRWLTTYMDMLHWGDNFMPEEMGFIYYSLGKPDFQIPYPKRGYAFNDKLEIYKRV